MAKTRVKLIAGPYDFNTREKLDYFESSRSHAPKLLNDRDYYIGLKYTFLVYDVIDNKIKIMDCCQKILEDFIMWRDNFGQSPCSKTGPHWIIDVKRGSYDRYIASYLDFSVFSEEQFFRIKRIVNSNWLQDINYVEDEQIGIRIYEPFAE